MRIINSLWKSSHQVIYDGNFVFEAFRTREHLCSLAYGMLNAKAKETFEIFASFHTTSLSGLPRSGYELRLRFSHEQPPTKEFTTTLHHFFTIFHATIFILRSRGNYHAKN